MQYSPSLLIDLNYHVHRDINDPEAVLAIHAPSQGYAKFLQPGMKVCFVKHAAYAGELVKENSLFRFFKGRNRFWHIPFATHRYIKTQRPAVVLIQGFVFPLQLVALRIALGPATKFYVQHHGEKPFSGIKKIAQQFADRFISGYLFSGMDNAKEWLDEKIISGKNKCFEILSASTSFTALDKSICRQELGISGHNNFLWVGHLKEGKDPLTVINAFEKLLTEKPGARLYLIYQSANLLPEIKQLTCASVTLEKAVSFVGAVPHDQLQKWYSACDYFISGSHREACGYAVLEAMACGCIPVVTAIPSFRKMTAEGTAGFLFEPGNKESLLKVMQELEQVDNKSFSREVTSHFNASLSFSKIAADLLVLFGKFASK